MAPRRTEVDRGAVAPRDWGCLGRCGHERVKCTTNPSIIYIIKERLETSSSMESYLPTSDRHAASWIFSDGPRQPVAVVKLRYNALKLFFDNVAI